MTKKAGIWWGKSLAWSAFFFFSFAPPVIAQNPTDLVNRIRKDSASGDALVLHVQNQLGGVLERLSKLASSSSSQEGVAIRLRADQLQALRFEVRGQSLRADLGNADYQLVSFSGDGLSLPCNEEATIAHNFIHISQIEERVVPAAENIAELKWNQPCEHGASYGEAAYANTYCPAKGLSTEQRTLVAALRKSNWKTFQRFVSYRIPDRETVDFLEATQRNGEFLPGLATLLRESSAIISNAEVAANSPNRAIQVEAYKKLKALGEVVPGALENASYQYDRMVDRAYGHPNLVTAVNQTAKILGSFNELSARASKVEPRLWNRFSEIEIKN